MVKEVDDYGVIRYYNKNGEIHREDGPAVILSDGTQVWHYNGKFHREDGPAVILADGTEIWYKNGKNYSFNDWIKKVNISNEEKVELVLKYG